MSVFGWVLFALGAVAIIIGIVVKVAADVESEKSTGRKVMWAGIAGLIVGLILAATIIVPAGHRGVLLRFGEVSGVYEEGLNMRLPFIDRVVMMSVRSQLYEADASSASMDLQDVDTSIGLIYRLDPSSAGDVYRDLGEGYMDVIAKPSVQEIVKAITAKFNAEDLILKRELVKNDIAEALAARLAIRGVIAEEINITNFDFSPEFWKAIEDKQVAEQEILKSRNVLERVKVEAQQAEEKAIGEANARIAKAEGEAQSIMIVTQAQYDANNLIYQSLSPEVLQYIFLDRLGEDIKVVVIPSGENFVLPSLTP